MWANELRGGLLNDVLLGAELGHVGFQEVQSNLFAIGDERNRIPLMGDFQVGA